LRALAKAAPFLAAQSYFTGRLSFVAFINAGMIVGRYRLRVMIDIDGPLSYFSSALSLIKNAAWHKIVMVWVPYITRLSQWGGGGYFIR
jgi:hypothetical protein